MPIYGKLLQNRTVLCQVFRKNPYGIMVLLLGV